MVNEPVPLTVKLIDYLMEGGYNILIAENQANSDNPIFVPHSIDLGDFLDTVITNDFTENDFILVLSDSNLKGHTDREYDGMFVNLEINP